MLANREQKIVKNQERTSYKKKNSKTKELDRSREYFNQSKCDLQNFK